MRVWGYARHSPGEKQTIDSQVEAIRNYCEENGLTLVHIFVDAARKGSTVAGRDEFLAMIDAAHQKPRPVEAIVFWAFDRLFRGYDQAQFHKAKLRLLGYELISITETIPEGPAGRLLEAVQDYMAEEELRKKSANIKRGLSYLKSLGCAATGFPPAGLRAKKKAIGTRPNGDTRCGRVWEPDPVTWPLVLQAWQMRLSGATLLDIHAAIPLFQKSQSWSKFFRNVAYRDAGACSPEEWDAVQAMGRPYREGGAYPRRKSSPYLLSSPDFSTLCAYCGGPIGGNKTTYARKDGTVVDWPYYSCIHRSQQGKDYCRGKTLKASMVDRAVLSTVLDQVLLPERVIELVEEVNRILAADLDGLDTRRSMLQSQLSDLDTSISHLLDAVEADGFQAAKERLEQRQAERAIIEAELAQIAQRPPLLQVDEYAIRAAVAEMRRELAPENTKAAKQVLGCFVDKIILARDGGELHYHAPLFDNQEPALKKSLPIAKVCFAISPAPS